MYRDMNTINKETNEKKICHLYQLKFPIYERFLAYQKEKNKNVVHKHGRNISRQFIETKMHMVLKQIN